MPPESVTTSRPSYTGNGTVFYGPSKAVDSSASWTVLFHIQQVHCRSHSWFLCAHMSRWVRKRIAILRESMIQINVRAFDSILNVAIESIPTSRENVEVMQTFPYFSDVTQLSTGGEWKVSGAAETCGKNVEVLRCRVHGPPIYLTFSYNFENIINPLYFAPKMKIPKFSHILTPLQSSSFKNCETCSGRVFPLYFDSVRVCAWVWVCLRACVCVYVCVCVSASPCVLNAVLLCAMRIHVRFRDWCSHKHSFSFCC